MLRVAVGQRVIAGEDRASASRSNVGSPDYATAAASTSVTGRITRIRQSSDTHLTPIGIGSRLRAVRPDAADVGQCAGMSPGPERLTLRAGGDERGNED